MNIYYHIDLT